MTSRWKWVSTADVTHELGLGGQVARQVVRRAGNKGWLETEDEEDSCFRLSTDLIKRLDEPGPPLA